MNVRQYFGPDLGQNIDVRGLKTRKNLRTYRHFTRFDLPRENIVVVGCKNSKTTTVLEHYATDLGQIIDVGALKPN